MNGEVRNSREKTKDGILIPGSTVSKSNWRVNEGFVNVTEDENSGLVDVVKNVAVGSLDCKTFPDFD